MCWKGPSVLPLCRACACRTKHEVPNENLLPVLKRKLAGGREDWPEASCRSRAAGVCEQDAIFM